MSLLDLFLNLRNSFMEQYFTGHKLYGDDFSIEQIKKWYIEEEEAYASLVKEHELEGVYQYHELNTQNGFNYIDDKIYENVLGIGSSYGYEFVPIMRNIKNITILEPSGYLKSSVLGNISPNYVKPEIDGKLRFSDASFDLITCFGTLHHIPNVNFVLSEMVRVLKPGGFMLIREPIRTMGDWRMPRKGLTKNERGIPYQYFDNFFKESKLKVIKRTFCESLFLLKLINKIFPIKYNSRLYQRLDRFISSLFSFNIHYHSEKSISKLSPGSIFFVLQKSKD